MEGDHLQQQKLSSETKETLESIAKKLTEWKSDDQNMQIMEDAYRPVLKPYVEELAYLNNIKGQLAYSFIRLKSPSYFPLPGGPALLIPIIVPEAQQVTASDQPFEVGGTTYITKGIRIAGVTDPVEFLILREPPKSTAGSQ